MLRSMTGFGKADCAFEGDRVSIEVSAVNHRFLDCTVRLPSAWWALEPIVKETARSLISRGKLSVTVNRKRGPASKRQSVLLDKELARQYIEASRELVQLLGSMDSLKLDVLAQLEGVFSHEEQEEDLDRVQEAITGVLKEALCRLNVMRETEGVALGDELRSRIALMRQSLATIEQRLPELNQLYEDRLRARIDELKGDLALTEERVALEIAIMADKGDVTEEVVRLKTHFEHTLELLERDEPVGRELNFLVQELQREINTLGSKVRDSEVTKEVMRIKSEIEKFREQVQNVE